MEQNRTERNGMEWNGTDKTERNGMEQNLTVWNEMKRKNYGSKSTNKSICRNCNKHAPSHVKRAHYWWNVQNKTIENKPISNVSWYGIRGEIQVFNPDRFSCLRPIHSGVASIIPYTLQIAFLHCFFKLFDS
ncbi:PREDICTED: uncharacterized protein LOC108553857 [Eufriesea mexicana]|uniref:uncharacterized protein LOC108553857 n=1 Tax=Eufriesea mexicana TaxID=516756 RepID=UPI00083C16D7|nr:PREDICTED: uncharacterized protein LOC108553857 [Eufriesea mexicana]